MEVPTVKTDKKPAPKWSSDEISKFLEIFCNYEVLWNIKHSDYTNRNKREMLLNKLFVELIEHGLNVPDLNFLRNKIKNIKQTYRLELQKIEESKVSGQGADDVYQPRLHWFPIADSFLREATVTRPSISNLKICKNSLDAPTPEDNAIRAEENLTEDDNIARSPEAAAEDLDDETIVDDVQPNIVQPPSVLPNMAAPKKRRYGKFAKVQDAISKLQKISENRYSNKPSVTHELDEYDAFAMHVAKQLRSLPVHSFVIIQDKIQSLISQERLRNLPALAPTPPATFVEIAGGSGNEPSFDEGTNCDDGSQVKTYFLIEKPV